MRIKSLMLATTPAFVLLAGTPALAQTAAAQNNGTSARDAQANQDGDSQTSATPLIHENQRKP